MLQLGKSSKKEEQKLHSARFIGYIGKISFLIQFLDRLIFGRFPRYYPIISHFCCVLPDNPKPVSTSASWAEAKCSASRAAAPTEFWYVEGVRNSESRRYAGTWG